jgi:hypothetical protein
LRLDYLLWDIFVKPKTCLYKNYCEPFEKLSVHEDCLPVFGKSHRSFGPYLRPRCRRTISQAAARRRRAADFLEKLRDFGFN